MDSSDSLSIYLGLGDGEFLLSSTISTGSGPRNLEISDFNRDGHLDLAVTLEGEDLIQIYEGSGNASFSLASSLSTDVDPFGTTIGDYNNDGLNDIAVTNQTTRSVNVFLNTGGITFEQSDSINVGTTPRYSSTADYNGDGALDLAIANYNDDTVELLIANTTSSTTFAYLNLKTQTGAQEALATVRQDLARVSAKLGNIGAAQSRLSHTVNYLQVTRENYAAANSKIVDADIAEEVAQMVRQQILQQAITAVLAQANQQPALVLQLLK